MIVNYQWQQYTQEEFNTARWDQILSATCSYCGNPLNKTKFQIDNSLLWFKNNKKSAYLCCSRRCTSFMKELKKEYTCLCCGDKYIAKASEGRIFCSSSCCATYYNAHPKLKKKSAFVSRSRLEHYIEDRLKRDYPNLRILFNDITAINCELDIYIPQLQLAFELNGIFHYEPIFNPGTLVKIQNRDTRKILECEKQNIELCVIDTTSQKVFNEKTSQPFYDIVRNLIEINLPRLKFGG
jgi:hypothetical protein